LEDYPNLTKMKNTRINSSRLISAVGFSNAMNPNTGELIKPLAPFVRPVRHAVYGYFVDYNDDSREKLRGKEYWKPFWDVFLEYLNHPESKMDGDVGILERKQQS